MDRNNETMNLKTYISQKISFGVPCIICGESVKLSEMEMALRESVYKVCDKCKAVVLKLREQEEQKGEK